MLPNSTRLLPLFTLLSVVGVSLGIGCTDGCENERFGCHFPEQGVCDDYASCDQYDCRSCDERFNDCEERGGIPIDGSCPTAGQTGFRCALHDDCYVPDVIFYEGGPSTREEMSAYCDTCQSLFPEKE